jgi:hypothetical protein
MHDPLLRPDLGRDLGKTGDLVQSPAEVAAEEARKCSDREQEIGASWQPGLSIRGEAAGQHEIVHMRVVAQVTRLYRWTVIREILKSPEMRRSLSPARRRCIRSRR